MPITTSIVPSPWTVVHIPRTIDTSTKDDHGNHPRVPGAPVVRQAMSITQFGRRGSSREILSAEYLLRTETTVHMAVANPTLFNTDDRVFLWPDIDQDGNYVAGTGIAYWVDGTPSDERQGPWPWLLSMFGGLVKLRKVT